MPWPTADSVLRTLPVESYEETAGKLTPEDVDRMVSSWRGKLAGAAGVPLAALVATETAEDAASRGARADALEQLATSGFYARDQLDVIRSAASIRAEAYRLVALYAQEHSRAAQAASGASSYSGEEYVENFTDLPVFGDDDREPGTHPRGDVYVP